MDDDSWNDKVSSLFKLLEDVERRLGGAVPPKHWTVQVPVEVNRKRQRLLEQEMPLCLRDHRHQVVRTSGGVAESSSKKAAAGETNQPLPSALPMHAQLDDHEASILPLTLSRTSEAATEKRTKKSNANASSYLPDAISVSTKAHEEPENSAAMSSSSSSSCNVICQSSYASASISSMSSLSSSSSFVLSGASALSHDSKYPVGNDTNIKDTLALSSAISSSSSEKLYCTSASATVSCSSESSSTQMESSTNVPPLVFHGAPPVQLHLFHDNKTFQFENIANSRNNLEASPFEQTSSNPKASDQAAELSESPMNLTDTHIVDKPSSDLIAADSLLAHASGISRSGCIEIENEINRSPLVLPSTPTQCSLVFSSSEHAMVTEDLFLSDVLTKSRPEVSSESQHYANIEPHHTTDVISALEKITRKESKADESNTVFATTEADETELASTNGGSNQISKYSYRVSKAQAPSLSDHTAFFDSPRKRAAALRSPFSSSKNASNTKNYIPRTTPPLKQQPSNFKPLSSPTPLQLPSQSSSPVPPPLQSPSPSPRKIMTPKKSTSLFDTLSLSLSQSPSHSPRKIRTPKKSSSLFDMLSSQSSTSPLSISASSASTRRSPKASSPYKRVISSSSRSRRSLLAMMEDSVPGVDVDVSEIDAFVRRDTDLLHVAAGSPGGTYSSTSSRNRKMKHQSSLSIL